jgi:hypothetical protein
MVEMSRTYYEEMEDTFKENGCKLKSAFTKGREPKNDPIYTEKFERFMEAHNELREYEYLKSYRRQIKSEDNG